MAQKEILRYVANEGSKVAQSSVTTHSNLGLWITIVAIFLVPILIFVFARFKDKFLSWFYWTFKRHKFVLAHFIFPNKQIRQKPVLVDFDKKFVYDKGVYMVDITKLLFMKNKPVGFWVYGNPNQLSLDLPEGKKFKVDALKSDTLRSLFFNKFIKELSKPTEDNSNKIMILILILQVVLIVIMLLLNKKVV